MALVTLTIPDEAAQRVAVAICGRENYQPTSQEDAIEFVKSVVFRWLTKATIDWEAEQVAAQMRANPDDPLVSAQMQFQQEFTS